MRRTYIDLHLCPSIDQTERVKALLEKSAEMGYSAVGIAFPAEVEEKHIDETKKICCGLGLDLVTRADLAPKSARDLLATLKKVRKKFEVIAVYCNSREVAIQAAKDRRVDLLLFLNDPRRHFFSASEAKLASEKSACLEINLSQLILSEGLSRIRLMGMLRRDVMVARKFGVPIVLSSGASEPYMLRRPLDYASLAYLIGLDLEAANKALSEAPRSIVERNRRKLSPDYICPGVYVIKRGGDC
ncbi:MAG: RNase P subunit p30 family protein [Candidatus Bathyarchaeia archaeon]